MSEIQMNQIGESTMKGQPQKAMYPVTHTKAVFDDTHTSQDEINKKLWEALSNVLVAQNVLAISEDGYWIVDGEKTTFKAVGEKGDNAPIPLLRLSSDGLSVEISVDGGDTWEMFLHDFNKLRVLGYVDSKAKLPISANIGDIYGVWNQEAQEGQGAYELWINTIKDWEEDFTITKIYDYDTELPSSATDGTAVLIPVTDLTMDKEKVDGYKVYKYSLTNNGWMMVLNTAEIYASKEDIINYGDNAYALVQGEAEGTYTLYKRVNGWVYFGTNASIQYHLVQNIEEGAEDNVLSGKAVRDAMTQSIADLEAFKQEVKDTYGDYTENPEFVKVVMDAEDKILYGVQADGNFYFGAGCPTQVKDYIQEKLDAIMGVGDVTEKIDTINEMIAFFDGIKNDETLQNLLATSAAAIAELDAKKVDKEEGKGLIPLQYIKETDSPEFIDVKLDSEEKVLEGIQKDGTKVIGGDINVGGSARINGDVTVTGFIDLAGATYKMAESPEWIHVLLDAQDKILCGIRQDGKFVADFDIDVDAKIQQAITAFKEYVDTQDASLSERIAKFEEVFSITESPEWLDVKLDAEEKILEGTREDGTKVIGVDAEIGGNLKVGGNLDLQGVKAKVEDNPEWIDVKTDSEDKILEGTRKDGTKVIETDVELGGNVTFKNGIPQQIKDYIDENASGGSGVSSIEYDEETGDLIATYDDASGVTDVYMDETTGDIYVEQETDVTSEETSEE